MANVDRPNGFKPVKTFSGAPVSAVIRSVGVTDGTDIFIGDALTLTSGLAAVSATNDVNFLGVAVGFGKKDVFTGVAPGAFSPNDVHNFPYYYDDSANTHTDWVVFYAPATDCLFEVQTATALTLLPGSQCDLLATAGSTTTGLSLQEITTDSNHDIEVVEVPSLPDNTSTLVWGRYLVKFITTEQAFHA